jgi:hypothetical protein
MQSCILPRLAIHIFTIHSPRERLGIPRIVNRNFQLSADLFTMAEIDAILQKYTDPETGSIHGASFVAVDANGIKSPLRGWNIFYQILTVQEEPKC